MNDRGLFTLLASVVNRRATVVVVMMNGEKARDSVCTDGIAESQAGHQAVERLLKKQAAPATSQKGRLQRGNCSNQGR